MGDLGSFSRVESLIYGAYFMYVPFNKKTAPGQLTKDELIQKLKNNKGISFTDV